MWFKASAPGSLMLLGEYAVLHGKTALACAVDKRMTVTLTPRLDQQIEIVADKLGTWSTDLASLSVVPPFQFVLACLLRYRKKLKSGCRIEITSEFSDKVGLGSSAAVTVATLAVLLAWTKSSRNLIREARHIIQQVQGVGSGADVAASALGGIVAYRCAPFLAEKLSWLPLLTVLYSGHKTPTVEAIKRVQHYFAAKPKIFTALCAAIHQCAEEGKQAILDESMERLGKIMNVQQGLMQALGVSTPLLDAMLQQLHAESSIHGAKISGSGLGDCVIGLGGTERVDQLNVKITPQGVLLDKNFI